MTVIDKENSVPRPLPTGEVMASGDVNGLRVEVVRYTEAEIRVRDKQWQYDVQRERDAATRERCHRMNLELDLRRLLDGEPTLNSFDVVEELGQRLTPNVEVSGGDGLPATSARPPR